MASSTWSTRSAAQCLVNGAQDDVNDLGRGFFREAVGQGGAGGFEDVGDGLLGADLGDVLGEGTPEPLERGLGRPGELGDLTAKPGAPRHGVGLEGGHGEQASEQGTPDRNRGVLG